MTSTIEFEDEEREINEAGRRPIMLKRCDPTRLPFEALEAAARIIPPHLGAWLWSQKQYVEVIWDWTPQTPIPTDELLG